MAYKQVLVNSGDDKVNDGDEHESDCHGLAEHWLRDGVAWRDYWTIRLGEEVPRAQRRSTRRIPVALSDVKSAPKTFTASLT